MSDEGKAAVVLALWSIAFHAGLFIAATKNRSVGLMLAVCATLILAVSLYADWKVESAKLAEARRLRKYKEDCARRELEVRK
jgi:hypothetical protein